MGHSNSQSLPPAAARTRVPVPPVPGLRRAISLSCFWTHFAAPLAAQLEMDIADANKGDTDDFERGGGMRTDVDALLVEHKAAIAELRESVKDCLPQDSDFYDDIFLLRFVLTWEKKGGLAQSSDAVRQTIEWRTKNAEALAQTVRTGLAPGEEVMKKFNTAGYAGSLAGISLSLCLAASLSRCLSVSLFRCLAVSLSRCLCLSLSTLGRSQAWSRSSSSERGTATSRGS